MSLLKRAVAFELALYVSLFRWVFRRPDVPAGADPVGYSRMVTPVMWLWIFVSAAEIPAFHLLVPWPTARIVLLFLSAWGLVWMVGILAALRVYPHLMDANGIRVRNGSRVEIAIPWTAIATIIRQDRDLASSIRTLQPLETEAGTDLQVGVSARVNVHVVLREPRAVPTHKGTTEIVALTFLVDDPREFVAAAGNRIGADYPA